MLPCRSIHGRVQPPVVLAPPVTEEVLVRPFADLDDRRPTVFHQLREEVERNADVVGDRLVLKLHEQRQEILHLFPIDQDLVMIGRVSTADAAGELEFVVVVLALVSDGERRHRPRHQLAHERDVHRGIDPA